MHKKIIINLVSFCFLLFTGYIMVNHVYADGSLPRAGGEVYGRIGDIAKGDRVLIGTNNTDSLLIMGKGGKIGSDWFAMTYEAVDNIVPIPNDISLFSNAASSKYKYATYTNTNLYSSMQGFNSTLRSLTNMHDWIAVRNQTPDTTIANWVDANYASTVNGPLFVNIINQALIAEETGKNAFVPNYSVLTGKSLTAVFTLPTGYGMGLSEGDLAFSSDYLATFGSYNTEAKYAGWIHATSSGGCLEQPITVSAALRPALFLDSTKPAVFALSPSSGTSSTRAAAHTQILTSSSNLYTDASAMKPVVVRLEDSSMDISFDKLGIKTENNVTKVQKDGKVKVEYSNATSGSNHYISALFTDVGTTNLKYYQVLKTADGSGIYELDTTNLPIGKYDIYLVNEEIDGTTQPANSSKLSSARTLEIVKPLEKPKYTVSYQAVNGSSMSQHEYSKNAKSGDKLGTVIAENGVSDIIYKLISDTSHAGHENDYQKLKLKTNADGFLYYDTSGNVTLLAAQDLDAGDYYFKVNAIGADGNPENGVDSDTFHIKVEKTNQPALKFYNDSSYANTITSKLVDKYDAPFDVYVKGGLSSISDSGITYAIKDNSTDFMTISGSGSSVNVTMKGIDGNKIITATKRGNNNYNDVSAELIIATSVNTIKPEISGKKQDNTLANPTYTSAEKYNGSVDVIIKKPASGKLMLERKTDPTTSWDDPGIIATEIGDAMYDANGEYHISIPIVDEEVKYEEFYVYVKNYRDNDHSATFIVDLLKKTPQVSEVSDGGEYKEDKKIKLDRNANNTYTATLNGRAYTSETTISEGTYTLVLKDEYGNTNDPGISFKIEKEGVQSLVFNKTKTLTYKTDSVKENFKFGTLIPTGGTGPYTFEVDPALPDGDWFECDPAPGLSGRVMIKMDGITPKDYNVRFKVTDANGKTAYCDSVIKVEKAEQVDFDSKIAQGEQEQSISMVYQSTQSPSVEFKNPTGSEQTFQIKYATKAENDTIISIDPLTGEITPLKAGTTYITVTSLENNFYKEKSFDVKVVIEKAEQNFEFERAIIETYVGNPDFKLDPKGNDGTGAITFDFSPGATATGIVGLDRNDGTITIIAVGTTKITAYKAGDDNFKAAKAEITIKVLPREQNAFKFIDTGPSILTYGDEAFDVEAAGGNGSSDITYSIIEGDGASVTPDGHVTILHAGNITLKAQQAAYQGNPGSSTQVVLTINKRPITVKVTSQKKKVGEELDAYQYEETSAKKILDADKNPNPLYTCDDSSGNPVTRDTDTGKYPITVENLIVDEHKDDYDITISDGVMEKYREAGNKAWYQLIGTLGDDGWYRSDVIVKIRTGKDYDKLSQDQSNWVEQFTLTQEGQIAIDVYFKNTITQALSDGVEDKVKIDKKAPSVTGIKAVNSNSTIEDILNDISFGNFFKPGTKINIYTDDNVDHRDIKVSGTKEVSYKIYPIDEDGDEGTPKTGTAQSTNEKATVTMNDVGRYKVCAIPKDKAGNPGEEQCAKVSIKDPEKDYDPNDLGCPSINLTMGTNKPILNIDRDGDGIPDMDIDIDGDGKPDINIDNDKDGKPDTNLVILKEWDPKICSTTEHSYGYMEDIKPLINIALDKEYKKPSINIDTTGDMKADINIDTNGDMKADLNIVTINIWKPEKNYIYEEFQYDTVTDLKRKVNIDTDGDGLPDVNIDYDGDGLPDLNIDINGDEIPDINIDTTGDGEPDINIDYENDGTIDANPGTITEWKPDLNTGEKDGFKYDTMSNIKVDDPIHELEHDPSGTVVETVDNNTSFNKKQTIIVADITNEMKKSGMPEVEKKVKENQEVKNVLDVKLYEDNIVTQPNGLVRVKIPLSEELKKMKNRVIMIEQKDGTYKEVSVKEENGYLVFETDYLGKVSIVADKEETTIHPDVDDGNKGNASIDNGNKTTNDDEVKSVKGASTIKGMGGAMTGDTTNPMLYISGLIGGLLLILLLIRKKKTDTDANE